jgi:hypothetical protein
MRFPVLLCVGLLLAIVAQGSISCSDEDPMPSFGSTGSSCDQPNRIMRSCGKDEIEVAGHAVFIMRSGQVRPVRRLTVSSELYGRVQQVALRSGRDGSFKFVALLPNSVVTSCVDGLVHRSEEWVSRYFILRASGCDDLRIEVTNEWSPHDVVMQCAQPMR